MPVSLAQWWPLGTAGPSLPNVGQLKPTVSNGNELFRVTFWHHLHLEIHLPLLVWEQAITHAFKAKPNCQVSMQFLMSVKSGEGSVTAAVPPPNPLDRSCPSHKSATANKRPQPTRNVHPALIRKRHGVRRVRKLPAAQDLPGCIAKEVSFKQ